MNPKVMICVPTSEFARRADFYDYFNMLIKPEGTMISSSHGQSPARNRNIMIRLALQQGATHILFLDDDMAFKPDTLMKLLEHDKDIVGGLYLMRNYPHQPIMFDEAFDDGRCRFSFLNPGRRGLQEVVNMGLGCALIKTSVFVEMCGDENPDTFNWITLGEAESDHWCDDVVFFNKVRKAGFKIYVDLEIPCGHMMTAIIWPNRLPDGTWATMYNTGAEQAFHVPQTFPTEEQLAAASAASVKS